MKRRNAADRTLCSWAQQNLTSHCSGGINVGGKNRLAMSDLRAYFEKAGALSVSTYIQSGNVVFTAAPRGASPVCEAVTGAIREHHGFEVPIVCQSGAALGSIVERCPFEATENVHVVFLSGKPAKAMVDRLERDRSPGDTSPSWAM